MSINRESKIENLIGQAKVLYRQDKGGNEVTYLVPQEKFKTLSKAGSFQNPFFGSILSGQRSQQINAIRDPIKKKEAQQLFYKNEYISSKAAHEAAKSSTGFIEFDLVCEEDGASENTEEVKVRFYKDHATTILSNGDEIELRGGATVFGSEETIKEARLRASLKGQIMREKIYAEFGRVPPAEKDRELVPAGAKETKQAVTTEDVNW